MKPCKNFNASFLKIRGQRNYALQDPRPSRLTTSNSRVLRVLGITWRVNEKYLSLRPLFIKSTVFWHVYTFSPSFQSSFTLLSTTLPHDLLCDCGNTVFEIEHVWSSDRSQTNVIIFNCSAPLPPEFFETRLRIDVGYILKRTSHLKITDWKGTYG